MVPQLGRGVSELLAAGDTVGARRTLASLDSTIAPQEGMMRIPPIGPQHFESAKYHLALGDTAGAEAQLAADRANPPAFSLPVQPWPDFQ